MLTLLACGQSQNGTYVELMLQAYKLRVYAEAGVFEAEECLRASLKTLDNYQVDPDVQIVRDYATRVRADGGTVEGFESTISSIKDLRNQDLYDKASLSLLPSGFKAGKAYSILPTNGAGDLNVSRNTTKTRTNGAGLIETVEANVSSLNYDTVGSAPSILIEQQATNLLNYSQDFSNGYWIKSNSSILENSETSPSGIINAAKLIENTANSQHIIVNNLSFFQNNLNYSFSVFVKPNGRDIIRFQNKLNNGAFINTYFNLLTGAISSNATDSSIKSFGNYFRISHTFNANTGTSSNSALIGSATTSGVETYTGDGVSGIFVWGAQLELGSYATSYIPTLESAVTRNQDLISKTGISDLIGQTEGTLFFEGSFLNSILTGNPAISISDGTSNNNLQFFALANNSSVIRVIFNANSNLIINQASFTLPDIGQNFKIAICYKSGDTRIYLNGVLKSTFTNTFSGLNFTKLGFSGGAGGGVFFGKNKSIQLYKTALADAECITLTS